MAFTLESIQKGVALRAPRIIMLGVEKIGKTCFSCGTRFDLHGQIAETGLNSPVIIPAKGEEGADDLGVPMFPVCRTFDEIMDALGVLYVNPHDYLTVILDSSSAMEPLIWASVCEDANVKSIDAVGGGYGKGYTESTARWRQITEGLDALRNDKGMASIIIGHVKVKRFDDPTGDSYDTYVWDIHEKAANTLFRWADVILFANTKVFVKTDKKGFGQEKKRGIDISEGRQRFLFTQKRPAHPGGGRGAYGRLPYELPLDWTAFTAAVAQAASITPQNT